MRETRTTPIYIATLLGVVIGALVLASWLTGAPAATALPQGFTDQTAAAGIAANQFGHMPGQAWGDVNNDGWLDLYLTGGTFDNVLYENQGDGTFAVSTLSASVAMPGSLSGGAVFGDYNNDGWSDLYVLVAEGPNRLFRNDGGAAFTDVTDTAGVGDEGVGTTGAWGDYDNDGFLDLYVANWFCSTCPNTTRDTLYHNNGDGTFTDVSAALGVESPMGPGFVASFLDYDNDNDLDIYLVNDKNFSGTGIAPFHNVLWRNDGAGCTDWCFTDVSEATGADVAVDGMGLAIADYDHDGDLDMYFSNAGPQVFLENQTSQGNPVFVDASDATGTGFDAIGWGAVFADFDNDTWTDLYLATMNSEPELSNRTFRNMGDGTFDDVSDLSGAGNTGQTLGVAYADYNKDGQVDLVIGNLSAPVGEGYVLYRNTGFAGQGHNWLRIRLQGSGAVNRDAIGSRIYLTDSNGVTQMQEVKSGSSLGSGNDLALHFGLDAATASTATVVWPDGTSEQFSSVPALNREVILAYPQVGVQLAEDENTSVPPGTMVMFTHELTNTGNRRDVFDLSVHPYSGLIDIVPDSVTLRPGKSAEITVSFTIPNGTPPGGYAFTLTATSGIDGDVSASVTDSVTVTP